MSNERKLLVYRDSKLIKEIALKGEAISLGREASCDIVLEADSVSRLHAKILLQEASVYLENQSSTGQLFLLGTQIEFAEWQENQDAKVGPFVLKWQSGPAAASAIAAPSASTASPSEEALPTAPESSDDANAASNFGFSDNWAGGENAAEDPDDDEAEKDSDDGAPDDQENNFAFSANNSDDQAIEIDSSENNDDRDLGAVVDQNQNTQIADSDAIGLLKITQGEVIGREIRLDQGFQWIVGRSAKCHVKIENSKLSRQHFKIVKIAGRYRLQDLGSANGTRLNGVAVSDAPLSPFDTIVAGPVEFQFLVAQPNLANAPAIADAPFSAQESTQFAPPPMVYGGDGGGNPFEYVANQSVANGGGGFGTSAPASDHTNSGNGGSTNAQSPKSLSGKAAIWWKDQPKNKRLMYVSVVAILIAILAMPASDESAPTSATTEQATGASTPTTQAGNTSANEPRSNDISPEFYLLSPEERRKVEDSYAKAQRARNASNWKEAVDFSKEVLKYVDKYKDIADILAESQTHFNDVIVGAVTKNLKNSLDAESQVQEQVSLHIEAGKKAISESRWADAQDQCARAVSLDPKNDEANKCYAAAYGQDANYVTESLPDMIEAPNDPNLELQAKLDKELESKKLVYQQAQELEQSTKLDQALDSYSALLEQVQREIDGSAIAGRYPASVASPYIEKNTELKVQIEQRIKDINFQYETEYRTQLIDAEQLIANQDYVRARETYDRVLNAAPNFQDVRSKRAELYRRMISEARGIYHEALIYESVGDLQAAIDKYSQSKRLLGGIAHPTADEYYRKAMSKLKVLTP